MLLFQKDIKDLEEQIKKMEFKIDLKKSKAQ
jgi:hypothetical protein